jgi:hypothetical protein
MRVDSFSAEALGTAVLQNLQQSFEAAKSLADRALAQFAPAEWLYEPAPGSNSAAVIVQHVAGNLRSCFTDFLSTDGEKPSRQRAREFDAPTSAAAVPALRAEWNAAWLVLFDTLASLAPADLLRTVTIRHEPHTVLQALQRQVVHYSTHVGQLVQLAKLIRGNEFVSLSIPRGQSERFNQQKRAAASK